MWKNVIVAGVLGWIMLTIWTFVVNGLFGFRVRIDMREIPQERQVYELLKANLAEPGRYICNPASTESGMFPENQPVYGILYGGVGHEAAGSGELRHAVTSLVMVLLATWLLSWGAVRTYARRVLFFVVVGLIVLLYADLPSAGIAGYPLRDALLLAANTLVSWTLAGLVVAARMKPGPVAAAKA
jgi:hypothetical protein